MSILSISPIFGQHFYFPRISVYQYVFNSFIFFADFYLFCRFLPIFWYMETYADSSRFFQFLLQRQETGFWSIFLLRIFVDFANFADCLPLLPLSPVYKYSNNSFQFCQFLTIIAQFCRFWRVLPILINFVFYHQYFQKIHHNWH